MSLTDRLEQARRSSQPTTPNGHESPGHARSAALRPVDAFAHVKASVHQALMESLGPQLYDPHLEQSDLELRVRQTLQSVINSENTPLAAADRNRIAQEVADEILGLGPLEPLLRDGEITEIMVNGPNDIYVERSGKIFAVDARFTSDTHLRRTIDKIVSRVGRRVDESSPMVDARLGDGSRVNAVIAPIALDGSLLTIRKFSQDPFTDLDLIAFGTLSPQARTSSGPASSDAATSSSPAAPARARRRCSTCSPASSPTTSASSPSRTRPSFSCVNAMCCASRPGRRTQRARVRSPSATWSRTLCVCDPNASSWVRSATGQRWTCCRP